MAKLSSKTESNEAAFEGRSRDGTGGFFHSDRLEGVFGETNSSDRAAVAGVQLNNASTGAGVYGEHKGSGAGIVGTNTGDGRGGFFHSEKNEGLYGETKSPVFAAVVGIQKNPTSTGAGIYGEHIAGLTAGFFRGNVIVTGDVSFPGADCAEDFTIMADVVAEPGTVMTLGATGELVPCTAPYDKRVAGVITGAGRLRPGIIMDRQGPGDLRRLPIALVGKVFCKVDASFGAIEVGDLLTSSATVGHAMKAQDPSRAFGTVIGKAMQPLREGCGLIPILISLQ